jgi:hypothetical protein
MSCSICASSAVSAGSTTLPRVLTAFWVVASI